MTHTQADPRGQNKTIYEILTYLEIVFVFLTGKEGGGSESNGGFKITISSVNNPSTAKTKKHHPKTKSYSQTPFDRRQLIARKSSTQGTIPNNKSL